MMASEQEACWVGAMSSRTGAIGAGMFVDGPTTRRWAAAYAFVLGLVCGGAPSTAWAQPPADAGGGAVSAAPSPLSATATQQWLVRAHDASRNLSYTGTFVVLSSGGGMSSSRVWHAAEGDDRAERIDALSGAPRSVFRHNDQVTTFLRDRHLVKVEHREAYGLFPHLLAAGIDPVDSHYEAVSKPGERLAGQDTQVIELLPRDDLRYGYRLWTEKRTGFAVRLQTLDKAGHVVEQAAFSELDLAPAIHPAELLAMMNDTSGYEVQTQNPHPVSADNEGWQMASGIPGFVSVGAFRREGLTAGAPLQWIFSDGLATVSLFIEPYGARKRSAWHMSNGVTHMLAQDKDGKWWVTAVGEVPAKTLHVFVRALQRKP